jgi:hypothetical protein
MTREVRPSSGPTSIASRPGFTRPEPSLARPIVQFRKGQLLFVPARTAIRILHELHLRSIESKRKISTRFVHDLTSHQAKKAFRRALSSFITSYGVQPLSSRLVIFRELLAFCEGEKTMGGLESAFLTMLGDMCASQQVGTAKAAVAVWKSIGPPQLIGGGLRVGYFLNLRTNSLSFFEGPYLKSLTPAMLDQQISAGVGMPTFVQAQLNEIAQVTGIDPGASEDGAVGRAEVEVAGCTALGVQVGVKFGPEAGALAAFACVVYFYLTDGPPSSSPSGQPNPCPTSPCQPAACPPSPCQTPPCGPPPSCPPECPPSPCPPRTTKTVALAVA